MTIFQLKLLTTTSFSRRIPMSIDEVAPGSVEATNNHLLLYGTKGGYS